MHVDRPSVTRTVLLSFRSVDACRTATAATTPRVVGAPLPGELALSADAIASAVAMPRGTAGPLVTVQALPSEADSSSPQTTPRPVAATAASIAAVASAHFELAPQPPGQG